MLSIFIIEYRYGNWLWGVDVVGLFSQDYRMPIPIHVDWYYTLVDVCQSQYALGQSACPSGPFRIENILCASSGKRAPLVTYIRLISRLMGWQHMVPMVYLIAYQWLKRV